MDDGGDEDRGDILGGFGIRHRKEFGILPILVLGLGNRRLHTSILHHGDGDRCDQGLESFGA